MGGDLTYVLNDTRNAFATPASQGAPPSTVGVGLAPEGIDNSAPYFSLVLDAPWTEQPDARSWFQEWGVGRCGKSGVTAAEQAYDLLFQSVYRPGKPYLFCCSKPKFCPTVHPGDTPDQPGYNASLVREALVLMVEASDECTSRAFRYDLVDVAREWLSMSPCIDAWNQIDKSSTVSPANLTSQVQAFIDVNADVDAMMATDEGFLLVCVLVYHVNHSVDQTQPCSTQLRALTSVGFAQGAWLNNSRAVSNWDGSNGALADFYECASISSCRNREACLLQILWLDDVSHREQPRADHHLGRWIQPQGVVRDGVQLLRRAHKDLAEQYPTSAGIGLSGTRRQRYHHCQHGC
jgi:hypothetical protein